MRWIIQKRLAGAQLTATAEYMGKRLSGQLKPYNINRFMPELTTSCLVDLHTEEGTFTFNCKYLKEIDLSTLEN